MTNEVKQTYPIEVPALIVEQPIGLFYITVLPVHILLDTCYSDAVKAIRREDGSGSYKLQGTQRKIVTQRLEEIGQYISTVEATFPNSIILAPNFLENNDEPIDSDDNELRWSVDEHEPGSERYILKIPTDKKVTQVIDGQHRLFAFTDHDNPERYNMELVCTIFMDLPKPLQAFIFATINSTQKTVNRSLTYELFGYNLDHEEPESWSPDKLAVFIARKLNTEDNSPLKDHILVAAINDFATTRSDAKKRGSWVVSMAVVVDGICKLISTNIKEDRTKLMKYSPNKRFRHILSKLDLSNNSSSSAPLRSLYTDVNDKVIYMIVKNFFLAVDSVFWKDCDNDKSFIFKTVGIQALFEVLKLLCKHYGEKKDFRQEAFEHWLQEAGEIDFTKEEFQNASGSGKVAIRNAILNAIGLPR